MKSISIKFVLACACAVAFSASTFAKGKSSKSIPCKKELGDMSSSPDYAGDEVSPTHRPPADSNHGGYTSNGDIDSAGTYGTDSNGFPDPNTAW